MVDFEALWDATESVSSSYEYEECRDEGLLSPAFSIERDRLWEGLSELLEYTEDFGSKREWESGFWKLETEESRDAMGVDFWLVPLCFRGGSGGIGPDISVWGWKDELESDRFMSWLCPFAGK